MKNLKVITGYSLKEVVTAFNDLGLTKEHLFNIISNNGTFHLLYFEG